MTLKKCETKKNPGLVPHIAAQEMVSEKKARQHQLSSCPKTTRGEKKARSGHRLTSFHVAIYRTVPRTRAKDGLSGDWVTYTL